MRKGRHVGRARFGAPVGVAYHTAGGARDERSPVPPRLSTPFRRYTKRHERGYAADGRSELAWPRYDLNACGWDMVLSPGTRVGPYEIRSLLGTGGMGEVYRALDPRLGRDIAIKVLPAEYANDADRLRRFQLEARAAAALNHPNIVTIHSVEKVDDFLFLTMEVVEGRPLSSAIPQRRSPSQRAAGDRHSAGRCGGRRSGERDCPSRSQASQHHDCGQRRRRRASRCSTSVSRS